MNFYNHLLRGTKTEKQNEADAIAEKTIASAQYKASATIENAETKAEQIVVDALNQANTATNAIQEQLNKLEQTRSALIEEVTLLQEAAITANNESDIAEKRLAKIKASIAQLADHTADGLVKN